MVVGKPSFVQHQASREGIHPRKGIYLNYLSIMFPGAQITWGSAFWKVCLVLRVWVGCVCVGGGGGRPLKPGVSMSHGVSIII